MTGSCWKELSNLTIFPTTSTSKYLIRLRHRHQLQLEQMRAEMKQMQEQHQREKQELERQNFIIQVRPGIFIFKLIDFLIRIIADNLSVTNYRTILSLRLRSGIFGQRFGIGPGSIVYEQDHQIKHFVCVRDFSCLKSYIQNIFRAILLLLKGSKTLV